MNKYVNERTSPRIETDITIFIEVPSASAEDQSEKDIVICKSYDLSSHGLQVVIDRAIPERRILRLCVDIKGKEPIFVVAEVVWLRQDEETKDYRVGFKLLDSKGTDLINWHQAISEIFIPED